MLKVSIIIPVYNRAHIVERTLDTVLAQEYRPLQVVLVDNDSTDGSLAVLEQWADEHRSPGLDVIVMSEHHHTAGAARNRGASVATGEWLVFFDSDDEMHPQLVSDYVDVVEQAGGEVDIVSTGATLRYSDGSTRRLPFHDKDVMAVQLLNSQLATQRYMVRASYFHQCDEWNINLPVWNDWELGMRLMLAEPRVAFLKRQRVTVNHSGEASITGNSFAAKAGQWEHVIDVVEVELMTSGRPDVVRLRRLLEFKRIILAAQYQREARPDLSIPLCRRAYSRLHRSYGDTLKWRLVMSPLIRHLFAHTVAGRPGSSLLARKLL